VTECHQLSDRIVDVVHGGAVWTSAEAEHLAGCAECRWELALIQAAVGVGTALRVDADGMARRVSARLAAPPVPAIRFPARRAFRWAGVLAAAAILVLAVRFEAGRRSSPAAAAPSAIVLGELEGLSATELANVLDEMPVASRQATMPSGAAGMSDLSADELQQVLEAWGG
jgi:hypothetical protein